MSPRSVLIALLVAGLSFAAGAQDHVRLPDLGSSAGALISPQEASQAGASMLHHMRAMHLVLDDPQINDYLNDVGYRLVAASQDSKQKFTFFVVGDQDINAFAAPGGYIGVNAGLIDLTQSESELAGVMAHEIGHISQHHLQRAFEDSKKNAPLMALVLLGAIAAGSSGHNNGDAGMAVLAGGQGLLAQKQINFTRADEVEADRVGIQTLARAGYNPEAMADFFQRMQDTLRPGSGGIAVPELLQTHPVTASRISDAKANARTLEKQMDKHPLPKIDQATLEKSTGPLPFVKDPTQLGQPHVDKPGGLSRFKLMRERTRVLGGDAYKLIDYYAHSFSDKSFNTPSNHYGYALALLRSGHADKAVSQLQGLLHQHPDNQTLRLAMARARFKDGQHTRALAIYADIKANSPQNKAVLMAYARALTETGDKKNASKAEDMLRPLLDNSEDPDLFQSYARASEKAGKSVRAGEAYAYVSYLSGRPFDSMQQFKRLLKRPDLDYYQRARIQANIAQLTPLLMQLRKKRVKTPDHDPDSNNLPDRSNVGSASQLCFSGRCR